MGVKIEHRFKTGATRWSDWSEEDIPKAGAAYEDADGDQPEGEASGESVKDRFQRHMESLQSDDAKGPSHVLVEVHHGDGAIDHYRISRDVEAQPGDEDDEVVDDDDDGAGS